MIKINGGKRTHIATTPFPKSGIKNTTVPQGSIQTKKEYSQSYMFLAGIYKQVGGQTIGETFLKSPVAVSDELKVG